MAEKPNPLILDALSRATADSLGLPLHGGKSTPGLFATTTPARQAAQQCKDEGYLTVVRTETRGKTVQEVCAITEKGLAYLLSQVSPRQVLEDFIRVLEARQAQLEELVLAARQTQAGFDALKASAEKVLQQVARPAAVPMDEECRNGSVSWTVALLSYLTQWHAARPSEDCPLPELYRQVAKTVPNLTIGHYHDGLRQLHCHEQVYFHPWTGPLYEIPEPSFALLIGHEIAYYASKR